eukprot:261511-Rhodomonas_salina.1
MLAPSGPMSPFCAVADAASCFITILTSGCSTQVVEVTVCSRQSVQICAMARPSASSNGRTTTIVVKKFSGLGDFACRVCACVFCIGFNPQLMFSMFERSYTFNSDISQWTTGSVTEMYSTFQGAERLNCDVGKWDTSLVTDMPYMFAGAYKFNTSLSQWNTAFVIDMGSMFSDVYAFDTDISGWETSSVESVWAMFEYAFGLQRRHLPMAHGRCHQHGMDVLWSYLTASQLTYTAEGEGPMINADIVVALGCLTADGLPHTLEHLI